MFHSIFCGTNGFKCLFLGFMLKSVHLPFAIVLHETLSILQITLIRSAYQLPIDAVAILGLQFLLQQTVLFRF
jgi:hypothetical protein